jgi:cellulose synthase operon protein C
MRAFAVEAPETNMPRCAPSLFILLAALVFDPAAARGQDDPEVEKIFERAETMAGRGQWSRALPLLEKVLEKAPDDEEAARRLALCYEATGRYGEWAALTERWTAAKPADREWLLSRVTCWRATGRDDDARAQIEAYVARTRGDYLLEAILAEIHAERGRDAEAEKIYDALIARSKTEVLESAADLTGYAKAVRWFTNDGERAEKDGLQAALKADKKFLPAYEELAKLYIYDKHLPADAARTARQALELRPRWPELLMMLVEAADLRLGFADAERNVQLETALEINPRLPSALFLRGTAQVGDAQWEKARETFEKALAVNPHHLKALSGRAALAYITNDQAGFAAGVARVLARDPGYGRVYQIVAQSLNERRRWDESVVMMRKAVAVDPKDPLLWSDLARYALYLGLEDEGKKALAKADELTRWGTPWRNNMSLVMEKLAESYKERKSEHFLYMIHRDEDPLMGRFLPSFFERSFAEFQERYAFTPSTPILVEMFKGHSDFSVRTMGTEGLGALGVCFGPTIIMDGPRALGRQPHNWCSTAHHELAHVFTLQLSRGRTPRWLTEGLSTWEEVRRNPSWSRGMQAELADALANDKLFKVLDFDAGFHGSRIIFAYYQGGIVCEWMEKTFGMPKICAMLKLYGEDKSTVEVLKTALDVTPAEFDAGVRAYVVKMLEPLKRLPAYDADMIEKLKAQVARGEDVQESRVKLMLAYFAQGKSYDADDVLKTLLDEKVEDYRIDLYQAARAQAAKAMDVAEKLFRAAAEKGARDWQMFAGLAQIAESKKSTDEAIDLWRKADAANPWELNPKRSPKLALVRLLRGTGKRDAAVEQLAAYCRLADTAVEPRFELVEHHLSRKDYETALLWLDEIHCITPFDSKVYLLRADCWAALAKPSQELAELETALDCTDLEGAAEAKVRVRLARLLLAAGRRDDAVFQLERAIDADPASNDARELLREAGGA